jgi:hypothetical protein
MKQTAPRCLQCGENPRVVHERNEGGPTYAPRCEECYLEDLRQKPEAATQQTGPQILGKKRQNLLELVVCKVRYAALGLAAASIVQLPAMFLNGTLLGVTLDSILIAIFAPLAAIGFILNRTKE